MLPCGRRFDSDKVQALIPLINASSIPARFSAHLGLSARVALLIAILVADKILLNQFVDFDLAQAAEGFGALVRQVQHWGFRFIAAFVAALALFVYVRGGEALKLLAAQMRAAPIRLGWLVVHIALLGVLVPLTFALFHETSIPLSIQAVVALWLLGAGAGVLALALVFAPASWWSAIGRSLGWVWLYALIAALLGSAAMNFSELLWSPTAGITFAAVAYLLRGTIPDLQTDTVTRILSSEHFAVRVTDICSGLEGVGLILAFLVCWLIYFRSEYRFPRALVLIPVGLAVIFGLNILRIAALMMIGDAGYPDVAIYGFHSQAGWISFITVACGLAAISRNSQWLNRTAYQAKQRGKEELNITAVYLLPLLTILGAGLISHALSAQFETFYPLRVVASLAVLWALRRHLRAMNWSFSWRGPAVGTAVFLLWWFCAHSLMPAVAMPEGLAALPPGVRWVWLASRLCGAMLTVPLAEELAYRGFLMRRLQGADFDLTAYSQVRWPALVISAVAFGIMHGAMWLPGIAAGLAYGLVTRRRSSLGEAVAAHTITNALAAVSVLVLNDWRLW
jgi:exosortase E/protease (VPEID-CTERM system)